MNAMMIVSIHSLASMFNPRLLSSIAVAASTIITSTLLPLKDPESLVPATIHPPPSSQLPTIVQSSTFVQAVSKGAVALTAPTLPVTSGADEDTIPILEIIKIYGKLATSACYGHVSAPGSSCQIPLTHLKDELLLSVHDGGDSGDGTGVAHTVAFDDARNTNDKLLSGMTQEQFAQRLQPHSSTSTFSFNRNADLHFQWPLKPYGITTSLDKTYIMNKGIETSLYMNLLERYKLYNPHNPILGGGVLPTSLRSQLNIILDQESINGNAIAMVFHALAESNDDGRKQDGKPSLITLKSLDDIFLRHGSSSNGCKEEEGEREPCCNSYNMDYYQFINLFDVKRFSWSYSSFSVD